MTRGEKAAATAKRNRELREAAERAAREDMLLIVESCRTVLNDPGASASERLQAAEMLLKLYE